MRPPPRSYRADGPLLVLSEADVFFLGRSSKRVVMTVDMTILVNYACPH